MNIIFIVRLGSSTETSVERRVVSGLQVQLLNSAGMKQPTQVTLCISPATRLLPPASPASYSSAPTPITNGDQQRLEMFHLLYRCGPVFR